MVPAHHNALYKHRKADGSGAGVGWPKKRAQNKPAMRGIFSGSSRVTALFGFACPKVFRFSSNSSTASVLQHRSISTAALLQLCSSTPQQLHRSSTEAPQQLYSSPRALLYNTAAAAPQQVYSGSTATLQQLQSSTKAASPRRDQEQGRTQKIRKMRTKHAPK